MEEKEEKRNREGKEKLVRDERGFLSSSETRSKVEARHL